MKPPCADERIRRANKGIPRVQGSLRPSPSHLAREMQRLNASGMPRSFLVCIARADSSAKTTPPYISIVPHRVVCPFCGLACDDVELRVAADRLDAEVDCARSRLRFGEQRLLASQPQVAGRAATAEEALSAAQQILDGGERILVTGLAVDVAGARAAIRLAQRRNAVLGHLASSRALPNQRMFERRGWITTTYSEARNHADCFVLVGTDAIGAYPRFVQRVAAPAQALFSSVADRRVHYLGPPDAALAGKLAPLALGLTHDAEGGAILDALLRITAGVRGVARSDEASTPAWVETLQRAKYGVIAWEAGRLPAPHAELIVEAILALIEALNVKTRFAGLPLVPDTTLTTTNQVTGWLAGFGLPVAFVDGVPTHDAERFSAARWIEAGVPDVVVNVAAWAGAPRARVASAREIVVAPALDAKQPAPEIFIPVAVPGVHVRGQIFRADGVVALPLVPFVEASVPSVAEVLARLEGVAAGSALA